MSAVSILGLTSLVWMVPFFSAVHLAKLFRLRDETALTIGMYSLIGMALWVGAWAVYGACWIYNHLCY